MPRGVSAPDAIRPLPCMTMRRPPLVPSLLVGSLTNGPRILLVSDAEAVFASACANVRAGYFDDPPEVRGLCDGESTGGAKNKR